MQNEAQSLPSRTSVYRGDEITKGKLQGGPANLTSAVSLTDFTKEGKQKRIANFPGVKPRVSLT